MLFDLEFLDIKGYNGLDIHNSFLKQKSATGPISIVLPGLHYNVDMPLLYYSTGVLLEAGHSVLNVDTRYSQKENFMEVSSEERTKWMFEDIIAVFNAVQQLKDYTLSVLVGKSLSTLQMAFLVEKLEAIRNYKIVWLTPLLKQNWLVDQMKAHQGESLIVIGTADPHYDDEKIAQIVETGRAKSYLIPGGNHSLDVPEGLVSSMEKLTELMSHMRDFVR